MTNSCEVMLEVILDGLETGGRAGGSRDLNVELLFRCDQDEEGEDQRDSQ